MLHKYLKYKNKYLSGCSRQSPDAPDESFIIDIVHINGESLYTISFDEYIYKRS